MDEDYQTDEHPEFVFDGSASTKKIKSLQPAEVIEYQTFLAKYGGHYGFWDDASHFAFLKLRGKFGV